MSDKTNIEALKAKWNEAKAAVQDNPADPTLRAAAKAAWAELQAASPPIKPRGGFGSRAGQRQAREREAMRLASLAAAGRRSNFTKSNTKG